MKKEIFTRIGDHLKPKPVWDDEPALRKRTIRDKLIDAKFPARRERRIGRISITRPGTEGLGFRVRLAVDRNPRYEWQGLRWCRIFKIKQFIRQRQHELREAELLELGDALVLWFESVQPEDDFFPHQNLMSRTLH